MHRKCEWRWAVVIGSAKNAHAILYLSFHVLINSFIVGLANEPPSLPPPPPSLLYFPICPWIYLFEKQRTLRGFPNGTRRTSLPIIVHQSRSIHDLIYLLSFAKFIWFLLAKKPISLLRYHFTVDRIIDWHNSCLITSIPIKTEQLYCQKTSTNGIMKGNEICSKVINNKSKER